MRVEGGVIKKKTTCARKKNIAINLSLYYIAKLLTNCMQVTELLKLPARLKMMWGKFPS